MTQKDPNIFEMVEDFQTKVLNNPAKSKPIAELSPWFSTHLPIYLNEELEELKAAINDGDREETLDALVDLTIFALGGMHQLGVDGQRAFEIVHRSNMEKSLGVKPARDLQGDATKPDNWTPPDLSILFK